MNKMLVTAALAGVFAAGAAHADDAKMEAAKEKCYGIAKAGKNDCKSATGSHSCAGQSTKDSLPEDWAYVTAGSCAKSGGKTEAPKS